MHFSGQCTLTLDRATRGTCYKYVVLKKGDVHWEELVEFPSHYYGMITDRFLKIPKKHLKPGGEPFVLFDLHLGLYWIIGSNGSF